jgi:hypothetical protein
MNLKIFGHVSISVFCFVAIFCNLVNFFPKKWKNMKILWILGIFLPFFEIQIIKLATSRSRHFQVTNCSSTFVKMLQFTYHGHHLMLISVGDPCQRTYLRNLKKSHWYYGNFGQFFFTFWQFYKKNREFMTEYSFKDIFCLMTKLYHKKSLIRSGLL